MLSEWCPHPRRLSSNPQPGFTLKLRKLEFQTISTRQMDGSVPELAEDEKIYSATSGSHTYSTCKTPKEDQAL